MSYQVDHTDKDREQPIFIITGFSGAGKSTVLRALEDAGFLCVDNLPIELLSSFFTRITQPPLNEQKIALGIDARSGTDMNHLIAYLTGQFANTPPLKIVFLTAQTTTLLKRFQETRRKHPLGNSCDILDAIEQEKQLLEPLKKHAHSIIDTDQLTIHELRLLIRTILLSISKPRILVTLMSFGFKYGTPSESNFIYDVRSLPNPYFMPDLRAHPGTHPLVFEYLFAQPEVQEYCQKLHDFFIFSIARSYREGRSCMTIALGCTGGRHRSVALVEHLARLPIDYVQFFVKHRDVNRETISC